MDGGVFEMVSATDPEKKRLFFAPVRTIYFSIAYLFFAFQ